MFEVDDAVWGLAVGLQGAEPMLDDLARTFGVDPAGQTKAVSLA